MENAAAIWTKEEKSTIKPASQRSDFRFLAKPVLCIPVWRGCFGTAPFAHVFAPFVSVPLNMSKNICLNFEFFAQRA